MKKSIFMILLSVMIVSMAFSTVTLEYWFWDPNFRDKEQEMIDKFEKLHPNIKVKLTALDPGSYWTKLAAMAAAKSMPDVMAMHPNSVEDLADQGALMDLTAFVNRDFSKDKYFWSVMESSFNLDGKYYGVPFAWVGSVMYYNKDLFDKYGVPYPRPDWTWNEFLEAAKKLTIDENGDGKIDIWGYAFFSRYAVFDGWILQNDGDYLDRENMRWDPDDNAKETIRFLYDLVHVHHVSPHPKDYDLDKKKIKILFSQGKAAMISEGSWNIKFMREDIPANFNWDINYFPRGPHWKENVMHAWADGLAISANSKHPQEAWEFIKFLINERKAAEYYPGKVPFYKGEAYSYEWNEYASAGKLPVHKPIILDYGENAKHFYTKYWKFWRGYASAQGSGLSAFIDDLLNEQITLDEFYEKADKEINRMLRKAYK